MPNNKKERKRNNPKKKEAQNDAQKKAAAVVVRAQFEAELQRKFGTPAIDAVITARAVRLSPPVAAAAGISSSFSSTTDDVVCYHGSSAEHFVAGSEFLKIVKSYVSLFKKCFNNQNDAYAKFFSDKENQKVMLNVDLANFIFALGVSVFLNIPSEEKQKDREKYRRVLQKHGRSIGECWEVTKTATYELELIIRFGLAVKHDVFLQMTGQQVDVEKLRKYNRDVGNERGIINCLYRETKKVCECMATDKDQAKDMDKTDWCSACRKFFPKERTKICDGCEAVVYCSTKCSIADWPHHKLICKTANYIIRKNDGNDDVFVVGKTEY